MSIIRDIDKENHKEGEEALECKVRKAFNKSQLYGQDKSKYKIVKSVVFSLFDIIFLLCGFLPFCYDLSKRLSVVHSVPFESRVISTSGLVKSRLSSAL